MIQNGFSRFYCEVAGKQAFMFLESDTPINVVKEMIFQLTTDIAEAEKKAVEQQKLQESQETEELKEDEQCQELVV